MALSDIIMCLTALPITPLYAFNGYWMFGETLCKLLPAFQVRLDELNNPFDYMILLQVLSVLVSSLSLTGIALDRYQAVSVKESKGVFFTFSIITSIDLFAVIMSVPYAMNMKV